MRCQMRHVELANGDKIPALGLGTWKMNDGAAFEAVKTAIENGYRHIDCAWIYENESDVGRAINDCIQSGVVTRDELWITSKLWNDCHRPEDVEGALNETLGNLNLEHLDLYLIHWPVAHRSGVVRPEDANGYVSLDEVPLRDTWQAMLDCSEKGLCRNTGVSNFNVPKMEQLTKASGVAPSCNQVESHPLLQQKELLQYCQDNRIAFTAYSPLGSGDRPDGMKKSGEPDMFRNDTIRTIAEKHNLTAPQILLAWAVCRGTVPIPKSANSQRQRQNLDAAAIELSEDDMQSIANLDQQYRYVDGKFWEVPGGPYTATDLWNA